MNRRLVACVSIVFFLLAGCAKVGPSPLPPALDDGEPSVYLVVGGEEVLGFGARDPVRDSWPHLVYRAGYGRAATLQLVGEEYLTSEQLGRFALSANGASVVTVWTAMTDVLTRSSLSGYDVGLARTLRSIREGCGCRVLVLNALPLEQGGIERGCADGELDPDRSVCYASRLQKALRTNQGSGPTPSDLPPRVGPFNAAIAQATHQAGAELVDVHEAFVKAAEGETELTYVGGLRLRPAGHELVAETVLKVLRAGPEPKGA